MVLNINTKDPNTYNRTILQLGETFNKNSYELQRVKELAKKIKERIERISPFIQQTTQMVCPNCKDVCCISKHGYYNYEDLVYLYALGLKPPHYEFGKKDSDPCQYLSKNGCSMERSIRPSGCNWYFCDSLLDLMETSPEYHEYNDALQNLANLWMEMIEELDRILSFKRS